MSSYLKLFLTLLFFFWSLQSMAETKRTRRQGGWNSSEKPKYTPDRRTRGRQGGWRKKTEEPVEEYDPELELKTMIRGNYVGMAQSLPLLRSNIDTVELELLNQDPVSTTNLIPKINARAQEVQYFNDSLALEAFDKETTPEELLADVFSESRRSFYEKHKDDPRQMPRLSGDIAVRLPFYQDRIIQASEDLGYNEPMKINFTSIVQAPSQTLGSSGYPREDAATDYRHRCYSGAFFNRSQKPTLAAKFENYNPGSTPRERRHVGLTNHFNRWRDLECRTPRAVDLYLDGKKLSFSCDPGGVEDGNTKRAIGKMRLCDPLIYGFIPRQMENSNRAFAACHSPSPNHIGRGVSNYSENIAGRVGQELVSMRMAARCPSCFQGKLESYCDKLARIEISPLVDLPEGLGDMEGSIWLAAKLAAENPKLWQRKQERHKSFCGGLPKKFMEYDHCQHIGNRIDQINKAIQLLEHFVPTEPIPDTQMVGKEKRSAG